MPFRFKGGTLIELNGRLMHLEIPQVPADKIDVFCSLDVFKIFNTNNIWVNLRAVKEKLECGGITMEILANKKKLSNGCDVIQLETSIGGAIRNFDKPLSVIVGRHRFLPVKSTNELLSLMSNAYYVDTDDYVLKLNPQITRGPIITLSPEFRAVEEFLSRFSAGIPDMSQLVRLNVIGNVSFGRNVKLVGDVTIEAEKDQLLLIEDESVIDGSAKI